MDRIWKRKKNIILHFFKCFITYTISAMIIWPLIDIFNCNVIEKKEFIYTVNEHIIGPIIFGVVIAILSTIFKIIKEKRTESK